MGSICGKGANDNDDRGAANGGANIARTNANQAAAGGGGGGAGGGGAPGSEVDSRLPLTAREKFSLQKNWKSVSRNLQNCGVEMMVHFLNCDEEVRQAFPKFRQLDKDQMRANEDFQTFSENVMQEWNNFMESLDDVDGLLRLIASNAKRHKKYNSGIQPQHFELMRRSLLVALRYTLGDAYTDNMERIYDKWTSFITTTSVKEFQAAAA